MRYENKTWKLLNVNELPKIKSGANKEKIDYKKCVGITLKYELKANGVIYEIKIIDYIKDDEEENDKKTSSKFKIQYIYLKGTEYEEVIEKDTLCNHLINKAGIGGIVPSLNQWIKKDNYWIGIDTKGREFKFSSGNKDTEYNILHSTWCVAYGGYVMTGSLNNNRQKWKIHKTIYFNCNKEKSDDNIHMCIDHINNNKADNRSENLRLITKEENGRNRNNNNKHGLTCLRFTGKGYYSQFEVERDKVRTKTKDNLEEAIIDNLIAQQYLGLKHNEEQFYKLEGLPEERIKEITKWLDKKMEENRNKVRKEKEYKYDFIEKNGLIGIKPFKRDGIPNEICWVDKDFGRVEENEFVVKDNVRNNGKGYFSVGINRVNIAVMVGKINLQNYRSNNFYVDHINQKTNENYRNNLEVVTIQSNMMNKKGEGYIKRKIKSGLKYQVKYAYNWKYINLYIKGLNMPTFDTEKEAIAEVKRRKEIANKYRFRIGWQGSIEANIKALDEVIDFAEEHKLDIDSAYIVWKGLDTEENIKKYLKDIDK